MVTFFVNNEEIFRNYEYHLVGNVSTLPEDIAYLNKIKTIAATVDNVYIHEKMDYPRYGNTISIAMHSDFIRFCEKEKDSGNGNEKRTDQTAK